MSPRVFSSFTAFFIGLAFVGLACVTADKEEQPKKPEDVSQLIYCMGCEYTVKAIDKLLQQSKDEHLDELVPQVLQNVCDEENFETAEMSHKTLVKICKFIIEKHETILEGLLTLQYSRADQVSYFDLSQQICLQLSEACLEVDGSKRYPEDIESGVVYDEEIGNFRVFGSKNLRTPNPVTENREDL